MTETNGAVLVEAPQREAVWGGHLLPPDLEHGRSELLTHLGAAYHTVMDERVKNWGLWETTRHRITASLKQRYVDAGFTAPPFDWDSLWARIDLPHPSRDPVSHVGLVRALMTDYQARLLEHVEYRMANDGNVHLEVTGPTGMGKSSCAIALADHVKPMEPARLLEHLSIDLSELPRKLRDKRPGETVVQDEYLQVAGEGSGTVRNLFANLEDTLRASQVNLFALSPRHQDHGTMQAALELILWHPAKKCSLFLVWLHGVPHGVVVLPWMRKELYEVYKPWKDANVERTMRGQFQDNAYLARMAVQAFQDERLVKYLDAATNKPSRKDFKSAVEFFLPQMMSGSQVDRLAAFMHDICYAFDRVEPEFEAWFGIPLNNGFRRVALKCYQE